MDHEKYDFDESIDSSMDLSSPNMDMGEDDEALDLAYTADEMRNRMEMEETQKGKRFFMIFEVN